LHDDLLNPGDLLATAPRGLSVDQNSICPVFRSASTVRPSMPAVGQLKTHLLVSLSELAHASQGIADAYVATGRDDPAFAQAWDVFPILAAARYG
jgi:hypothetical protein